MSENYSRRQFIETSFALCAGLTAGGASFVGSVRNASAQTAQTKTQVDRGPRLNLELVQEFVIAGHRDLEKVKSLLAAEPKLINAAWDWGRGDWETALGGAAHVGKREIALLLLEKGARIDVFAAAMLGQLEIVKAAVKAFPETQNILGPHGIPLVAHAKAGGAEAAKVLKYLESLKKT